MIRRIELKNFPFSDDQVIDFTSDYLDNAFNLYGKNYLNFKLLVDDLMSFPLSGFDLIMTMMMSLRFKDPTLKDIFKSYFKPEVSYLYIHYDYDDVNDSSKEVIEYTYCVKMDENGIIDETLTKNGSFINIEHSEDYTTSIDIPNFSLFEDVIYFIPIRQDTSYELKEKYLAGNYDWYLTIFRNDYEFFSRYTQSLAMLIRKLGERTIDIIDEDGIIYVSESGLQDSFKPIYEMGKEYMNKFFVSCAIHHCLSYGLTFMLSQTLTFTKDEKLMMYEMFKSPEMNHLGAQFLLSEDTEFIILAELDKEEYSLVKQTTV